MSPSWRARVLVDALVQRLAAEVARDGERARRRSTPPAPNPQPPRRAGQRPRPGWRRRRRLIRRVTSRGKARTMPARSACSRSLPASGGTVSDATPSAPRRGASRRRGARSRPARARPCPGRRSRARSRAALHRRAASRVAACTSSVRWQLPRLLEPHQNHVTRWPSRSRRPVPNGPDRSAGAGGAGAAADLVDPAAVAAARARRRPRSRTARTRRAGAARSCAVVAEPELQLRGRRARTAASPPRRGSAVRRPSPCAASA